MQVTAARRSPDRTVAVGTAADRKHRREVRLAVLARQRPRPWARRVHRRCLPSHCSSPIRGRYRRASCHLRCLPVVVAARARRWRRPSPTTRARAYRPRPWPRIPSRGWSSALRRGIRAIGVGICSLSRTARRRACCAVPARARTGFADRLAKLRPNDASAEAIARAPVVLGIAGIDETRPRVAACAGTHGGTAGAAESLRRRCAACLRSIARSRPRAC